MKIFLSALENAKESKKGDTPAGSVAEYLVAQGIKMKWNLMSYYYIRGKTDLAEFVRDNSEEILIDSGAHSFQFGKKVDFEKYTREYADFIKRFDRPNVLGYFEMDIDNVVGYEEVLRLRKILEKTSDKIIPVWHKERGIDEYIKMCQDYAGKIVSVTGFKNTDIKDEQYLMFLKCAREYGCKVHCLGMTRKQILDKVPFDFVDSSSWVQQSIFGMVGRKKVSQETSRTRREVVFRENYLIGMEMQKHYYRKWRKVCGD